MYSLTIELAGGTVTIEHEDFGVIEVLQEFVETQEEGDWEIEYVFDLDFCEYCEELEEDEDDEIYVIITDEE
jgi:hypothetical protein